MIASASNTTIRFGNFFMAPCLDSQARGFELTGVGEVATSCMGFTPASRPHETKKASRRGRFGFSRQLRAMSLKGNRDEEDPLNGRPAVRQSQELSPRS